MISFEEAYGIVLGSAFHAGRERVHFTESLNRVLSCDVTSDIDMPPFNKASVDGFACRRSDLDQELDLIETIPAGKVPEKKVGEKQCSKIMTGAFVPEGADCVIMVEDTEILSSGKIRFKGAFAKRNIAEKGEDVKIGDIVLRKGRLINPQDIAVMALTGYTSVTVSIMPSVAVISSGSELVEPSETPGLSQIRNSNSYQLMAQISRAGARGRYYGIARDSEEEMLEMISMAISENNILIVTGGVSMGDFDFVPSVFEKAGVRILFTRVAVQPGKPTTFGVHKKALVFGLPGNPVSSFIQFEMLVKPLIFRMMECGREELDIRLPMGKKYTRNDAERMAFIPVVITTDRKVLPVEFHGSAHISAIPGSDGIISLKVGSKTIEEGEIVNVRQI